jgi:hypothetical protein
VIFHPNGREVAERLQGGGLLNLPPSCRFNLPNNLQVGASPLKWGDSASFGLFAPHFAPQILRARIDSGAFAAPTSGQTAVKEVGHLCRLNMWPMCRHPVTLGGGSSSVNTGRVSPRGGVGAKKSFSLKLSILQSGENRGQTTRGVVERAGKTGPPRNELVNSINS